MSRKYKFKNESGVYFISTAVVYWIDVLPKLYLKINDIFGVHKKMLIYRLINYKIA